MSYQIPKNPRSIVKQAGLKSKLLRQGGNLLQYGKDLVKNPIKQLGKNLKSGGTRIDAEKRFDVLENAFDNAINSGKRVEFSALNPAKTDGNFISRGIDKLRGTGILAAGRKSHGQLTGKAKADLMRELKKQNLLYKHKGKGAHNYSIHRDADVDKLQAVYDQYLKGAKVKKNSVSMLDKARGLSNYVPLPGERGVFLGGAALGMGGQLANKETKDGRQRGLGERLARAGTVGLAETIAAPLGVANRVYGGLGTVAEQGLVMGTEALLNKNNKRMPMGQRPQRMAPQQPQRMAPRMTPQQPQMRKQANVYKNPRAVLRRVIK